MFGKGRKKGDKVFDNAYNQGTLENINDSDIEIDAYYRKKYLESEYNMGSSYRLEDLSAIVYDLIKANERFAFILKDKKIIKKIVSEVLQYLLEELDGVEDYTFADKFFVICNVLDLKGNVVYENLPIMYQDIALEETMNYMNVLNKSSNTSMASFVEDSIDDIEEDDGDGDIISTNQPLF